MKTATEKHFLYFLLLHVASLSLVLFSFLSELYLLTGYVALFLLVISGFWMARLEKELFWISFYFIFALSSTTFISVFVEHGVYLWEIKRWSHATGLTAISWYQVLLVMSGVFFAYRMIDRLELKFFGLPPVLQKGAMLTIRVLALFFIGLLFGISLLYGTPSENDVHRMDYWAYYAPSWGGTLAYWLIQLSFPLGYMFAKRRLKLDVVIFFTIIVVSIYMGQRFTGIVLACFFFFIPIAILNEKKPLAIIFSWKGGFSFCTLFVVILATLLSSYNVAPQQALEMMVNRAVVQAQMWWALNETASATPLSVLEILQHYFGLQTQPDNSGVYYLMRQVAPEQVVNYRIDTGSSFTMSGVFNNIHFFGYALGSVINVLYGAIFGIACAILKKAIQSSNLIVSLFAFKLMYKLMVVLLTGNTDQLFTLGNFAFFVIVFLFVRLRFYKYENLHF